jgi:polyisoprenoid-binding protein YceI
MQQRIIYMDSIKRFTQTMAGKIIAAGVAAAVVAGIIAAIYVFGGSGGSAGGHLTTPTLTTNNKDATVFTIDQSSSTASFTINEVLFGNPNTVVGKTNQVAGQISVDTKDPSQSQLGTIKVDLSALATDNDLRNHTLQGRILETGDPSNQFATFVATAISGLPETITAGQPVSFTIAGNLTIHGVTKPATFQAQLTLDSAAALHGTAQTTVKYKDFNIAIPDVPSVSGVSDTVQLALDFTAKA